MPSSSIPAMHVGRLPAELTSEVTVRAGVRLPSRFTAAAHGPGFWVTLWTLAVAAEFGALVPIIFGSATEIEGADVVYRLVGGSFAAFGLIAWHRRPDS